MEKFIVNLAIVTLVLLGPWQLHHSAFAAPPIIPGYERWLNDYIDWGSENDFSKDQVIEWGVNHPDRRIIDLEIEEFFGLSENAMKKNRYAFIWIENNGVFKADTIIDFFITEEALNELKYDMVWRPIDLEVNLIGVKPVYTIVRVPHAGYDWNWIPFMPDYEYNEWHESIVDAGFRPVDVEVGFGDKHVDVLFAAGLYVDNPENLKFKLTHFGQPALPFTEGLGFQLIDADPTPAKWAESWGFESVFKEYIGVFVEIPQSTHFEPDLLKDEHDSFAMSNDVRMIDIERTGEIPPYECEDGIVSKCNPEFEAPNAGPLYLGVYLETYKVNDSGDPGGPGPKPRPD